MKKSAKIWLAIASILVVLGLILVAGVLFTSDWDFFKLNTVSYETNTYTVDQAFDSISIQVNTTEVTFAPTDEETCSIVCYEPETLKHSAGVQNGVLTIYTVDMEKWYDRIGISFGSPQMTVYLPNDNYTDLFIDTDTGDILIPKDFSFRTLEIVGNTGDVDCFASVSQAIQIETDSGNIKLDGMTAGKVNLCADTGSIALKSSAVDGTVELETDSGNINLTDVHCSDLQAESDTGDIDLKNVAASGRFSIETNSGEVYFDRSDALEIFVETSTGDVEGNLLTDKVFITETDTGRVNVPKAISGGRCEIITDTGDINVAIK